MGWNSFWRRIIIRFLNLCTIVFFMNISKFLVKTKVKVNQNYSFRNCFNPWIGVPVAFLLLPNSASADRERNPLSQSYSWKFCPSTKENCNFCIIRGTRFGAPQLVGLHVSKRLTGILLAMERTYLGQSKWNTCHGPLKYTIYPSTSSLCT